MDRTPFPSINTQHEDDTIHSQYKFGTLSDVPDNLCVVLGIQASHAHINSSRFKSFFKDHGAGGGACGDDA